MIMGERAQLLEKMETKMKMKRKEAGVRRAARIGPAKKGRKQRQMKAPNGLY